MNILGKLKSGLVYFDGGKGSMLQSMGLLPGEQPELWNLTHPDEIIALHKSYIAAGCDIINANTFGANPLKFDGKNLPGFEKIIKAAMGNARAACCDSDGKKVYVALDIGPLGRLLKPLGTLAFEAAVNAFAKMVRIGAENGADLVLIETMNDSYETKAAVLAAKENCSLPIFVTNAYDESGKLMTGATPAAMVALLEGLGADAIGMNCGLGPRQMKKILPELIKYSSVPVIVTPNAGLPKMRGSVTVYDVDPEEFAADMAEIAKMGASILGGCCGTTPEHIRRMIEHTRGFVPAPVSKKDFTMVSSYTHAAVFDKKPLLIGERINPTGKKRFKEALRKHNLDYILNEGISQQEHGADILDVNVGLPEIDEPKMLCECIERLQGVTNLPLQIDTSDFGAMERAMRIYNGKPMVNSVNGKAESMEKIFPLVKKYGGVVVALTLDESGIPDTPKGRAKIAEKIYKTAAMYGIEKKDIVVDTLVMTVSSDKNAASTTLDTLKIIKKDFDGKTSLGVSNVSFGLPNREFINSTFFAMALASGLDAAIMNPFSQEMMKSYYSFCALSGIDERCEEYIDFASSVTVTMQENASACVEKSDGSGLKGAIIKGLKEAASEMAAELLKTKQPLEIIDGEIIPALNFVGKGFESKTLFLPQLLISAETAKSAFEVIKRSIGRQAGGKKCKVIVATVFGDIHDIGKNIVKVLLESYNFDVIDLGKDVPPEKIVKTAKEENVPLVGLSALMTTTVPAMENTIKLLREQMPECRVMVGGAVLTQEYADMMGADSYSKDAMGAVHYAEKVYNEIKKI